MHAFLPTVTMTFQNNFLNIDFITDIFNSQRKYDYRTQIGFQFTVTLKYVHGWQYFLWFCFYFSTMQYFADMIKSWTLSKMSVQ